MDSPNSETTSLYIRLPPDSRVIRLLYLSPGCTDAPEVHCQLITQTLSEAEGRYKALSYTWEGERASAPRRVVYCNKALVQVTPNLYEALRRLRGTRDPVALWVDSLCIDQANDEERTHQVGMMRDIYAKSSEVIIWLGAGGQANNTSNSGALEDIRFYGDERDFTAVDCHLRQLLGHERVVDRESKDYYSAFCLLSMLAQGLAASKIWYLRNIEYAPPTIRGLNSILDKSWVSKHPDPGNPHHKAKVNVPDLQWARIWVVQETVVAQRAIVYCNNISMPWEAFCKAATNSLAGSVTDSPDSIGAVAYGPSLARLQRKINEIESTRRAWVTSEPTALLPLLRKFRRRGASDKRDKVFTLLGLVSFWGQDRPLIPDYRSRPSDVYLETTKRLIRSSKSLAVLSGSTASRQLIGAGFPSWITDWSWIPPLNGHMRLGTHHLYNSTGDAMDGIQLHGKTLLQARGYHIDTVQAAFTMDNPKDDKELLRAGVMKWREWLQCPEHIPYCRGGTVWDAFWRTVCGNVIYVPEARTERERFRKAVATDASIFGSWSLPPTVNLLRHRRTSVIDGTVQGADESLTEGEMEVLKQRNAVHLTVNCVSRGRCFLITRGGLMGIAASAMLPGDEVFALQGSRVPLILRRSAAPRGCRHKTVEKLVLSWEEQMAARSVMSVSTTTDDFQQEAEILGTCNENHDVCYQLVGDAYIHGAMEQSVVWEDRYQTRRRKAESVFLI